MSNKRTNPLIQSIINEKEGITKTIKVVNKETKEETDVKDLMNSLVDKVEAGLNLPTDNTIKGVFKTLMDLFTMDFIARIMTHSDSSQILALSRETVREDIAKFGLMTMLLYPHLIENKLELKVEERELTEDDLTSINNVKKLTSVATFFAYYGIKINETVGILYKKDLITEEDMKLVGLLDREIELIKDTALPKQEIIDQVVHTFNNYESMINSQSSTTQTKKTELN